MKTQKVNSSFNIKNVEEILPKKKVMVHKTVTERTVIAGSSKKDLSTNNPGTMPNECVMFP